MSNLPQGQEPAIFQTKACLIPHVELLIINTAFHLINGVGKSIFLEKSINLKLNILKVLKQGLVPEFEVTG